MEDSKPVRPHLTLIAGDTDQMVMWERMCRALTGREPTEAEREEARAMFAAEDGKE